jgi:hypothetical protein
MDSTLNHAELHLESAELSLLNLTNNSLGVLPDSFCELTNLVQLGTEGKPAWCDVKGG